MGKIYWALKNKKGKIVCYSNDDTPVLEVTKKIAQRRIADVLAWSDCRPVRVTITEVE